MYCIKVNKEEDKISIKVYQRNYFVFWKEINKVVTKSELQGLRHISKLIKKYDINSDRVIDKTKLLIK